MIVTIAAAGIAIRSSQNSGNRVDVAGKAARHPFHAVADGYQLLHIIDCADDTRGLTVDGVDDPPDVDGGSRQTRQEYHHDWYDQEDEDRVADPPQCHSRSHVSPSPDHGITTL